MADNVPEDLPVPDTAAGETTQIGNKPKRKRRRKVLSCYDCRRKKIQCDRELPSCGQCTKLGRADNCLYIDDKDSTPRKRLRESDAAQPGPGERDHSENVDGTEQPSGPSRELLFRLEYQDERIKELETALARAGKSRPANIVEQSNALGQRNGEDAATLTHTAVDWHANTLLGESFNTRYHGPTSIADWMTKNPKFDYYSKEVTQSFPALDRIRQNTRTVEDRTDRTRRPQSPRAISGDDLKALLPPREAADYGVRLYLESYGCIYHVLYLPTFWEEYEKIWTGSAACSPDAVAITLLMISASRCLWSETKPGEEDSFTKRQAVSAIQACETWLKGQRRKHTTAADFQIRFLILISKVIIFPKFKSAWAEACELVRFCMDAGLHRDPDIIQAPTSAVDKELRRRIWLTVAEIELSLALDRGMPPVSWLSSADCGAPSAVAGGQINADDLSTAPSSSSLVNYNSSSYLDIAAKSLSLRHKLATLLNDVHHHLSFNDAKSFTDRLYSHLDDLSQSATTLTEAALALLKLNLLQYVLILNDRQAHQASSRSERTFSRTIVFEAASDIVTSHDTLLQKGNVALLGLCHDQLRAGLTLCNFAMLPSNKQFGAIDQTVEPHALALVDTTIEMLTHKLLRFGRERRYLWIALVARGMWKAEREPGRRRAYLEEVVDKMVAACHQLMARRHNIPLDEANDIAT